MSSRSGTRHQYRPARPQMRASLPLARKAMRRSLVDQALDAGAGLLASPNSAKASPVQAFAEHQRYSVNMTKARSPNLVNRTFVRVPGCREPHINRCLAGVIVNAQVSGTAEAQHAPGPRIEATA